MVPGDGCHRGDPAAHARPGVESDKLAMEDKFYKRNLEFVNRTFTLPMGLTSGNGNSGAGRNQISVDDSLTVEI